jgi:hypothetical protein
VIHSRVNALLTSMALAALVAGCGSDSRSPAESQTEQAQLQDCRSGWADLGRPVEAQPVPRLTLRDGDTWLHAYTLDAGRWIATCQGGPAAGSGGFGTIVSDGPDTRMRFHGGYDSVLKGHLLLGHPPPTAARIHATLASGQRLDAAIDGDLFIIWKPGIDVEGAEVVATNADGVVLQRLPAPTPQQP